MYLKSIEVHGFKSFANKIKLEFHEGITGIVGPNGSGKSNVADAVRWVLGEQSAKQLRGSNMQDVIFSGSEARKPLGIAYVAITFDNQDHKLPIDFDVVTVARRVYRSGESEYLVNGNNCRLRDVQELFLDTGIGKEGYSIIGQGQIDRIISTKPEERRELFDEAAGIMKFKKRKGLAEKNLSAEQLNLSRVADILSELEKQLGPLKQQSIVAKQYLNYREELKVLEVNQFLQDYEKGSLLKDKLDQNYDIVSDDLASTKAAYERTKAEYESLEKSLTNTGTALEESRSNRSKLMLEMEKGEGDMKVLKEQVLAILREESINIERLFALEKEKSQRNGKLEGYIKEKEGLDLKIHTLNEKRIEANLVLESIREKILCLAKELEQINAAMMQSLHECGTIKTALLRYETIRDQNTIRKVELNQKRLVHKMEEEGLLESAACCEKELASLESSILEINRKHQGLEQDIQGSAAKSAALSELAANKQQEFLNEKSRMESMKNIAERYDGYGNSIRRVMERRNEISGIIGVISDIIRVDRDYETAIETALGGSIQNIVTDNEQTAKAMIEFLKKNHYGRATFLPLTSIGEPKPKRNEEVFKEPGVVGNASDLVRADIRFQGLVQFLLGRTIVVDHIDHALAIAKKYHYSLRLVTLEGEQLNPGGSLSGGAYRNSSNLLGRNREIEELQLKVSALLEEFQKLQEERRKQKEYQAALRLELEESKNALQLQMAEQNKKGLNKKMQIEKITGIKAACKEIEAEMDALSRQEAQLDQSIKKQVASLQENELGNKEMELAVLRCRKQQEEEQKMELAATETAAALRVELANVEQGSQYTLANIKRVKEELLLGLEEEEKLRQNTDRSLKAREEKERFIESLHEKRRLWEEEFKALDLSIEEQADKNKELATKHKRCFVQWEELSSRKNELDKEVLRLKGQRESLAEQLDLQIGYIWEEYELTLSSAEEYRSKEFINLNQNKKNIVQIKGKIRSLGDVNVSAIEEFKTVSERFQFLIAQRDDIKQAEETLEGLIKDLEVEMREQFRLRFSVIQEQFNKVFKELFGGGRAGLELTEEEDILDAGIRIIAQPPGKKLQNMMQMSGGEKALTAISLLFAIQNMNPSPFCLLDEIEAALDDPNVKRFSNYLRKLTKNSQFIVITHRRGTMVAADVLYGITMQEKGVSTLVSVSLIDNLLD